MSEMWNRTLVYLGLREESDDAHTEATTRFDPEDDPHAEHAPERPHDPRPLVGAAAGTNAENGRTEVRGSVRREDDDRGRSGSSRSGRDGHDDGSRERGSSEDSNVRSLRTGDPHVRSVDHGSTRVTRVALVEVEAFEDVESIGSRFRTGQPVLFDIHEGGKAEAQRVVDFVSGLTYASRGRLTKVGSRAFLLVPDGVEIADDEQRRLRGLGYRLPVTGDA